MTKMTHARYRRVAMRQMKEVHDAELEKAVEAQALSDTPMDLRNALTCIAGRERPLKIPTGADLSFREDLARYWARLVERRIADECDQHFIAGEVRSESWACPAHRPVLPLHKMRVMAIQRLKRPLPHCAYVPTFRLRKEPGRPIELIPSLRFLAFVTGSRIETIERSVTMICRDLDPRGETPAGAIIRPFVAESSAEQFAQMLTFGSGHASSTAGASPISDSARIGALSRMMIAATIPFKAIAGASGTMKADLRLALGQAKAAAVTRHGDGPSPIAQSEIYPALSEMMPTLNGRRMRLPFCLM